MSSLPTTPPAQPDDPRAEAQRAALRRSVSAGMLGGSAQTVTAWYRPKGVDGQPGVTGQNPVRVYIEQSPRESERHPGASGFRKAERRTRISFVVPSAAAEDPAMPGSGLGEVIEGGGDDDRGIVALRPRAVFVVPASAIGRAGETEGAEEKGVAMEVAGELFGGPSHGHWSGELSSG